jgi:hypothetical protein
LAICQQVVSALELLHGAPRVPPEDAVNRQLQEVLQRPHERAVVADVQQPWVLSVDPGRVRRWVEGWGALGPLAFPLAREGKGAVFDFIEG